LKLATEYPEDVGVLSPLILNLILLRPGQAMFLPSGVLHAYLRGVGIELMANSDNVLRGGLTPKHVDVPELLKVLRFEGGAPDMVVAAETRRAERVFSTPAAEFVLSVISMTKDETYTSPRKRAIEILLCTEGEGSIREAGGEGAIALFQGTSVVVPASAREYEIRGELSLYKAGVPL
jgi:mannose-6-phosphate isomerase